MATIIVRKLDANGDPMRGSGLGNFLADLNAVAQILSTRLKLLQAEWFLNLSDGTPLFQSLLGHAITTQGASLLLRSRILATPYVTTITEMSMVYEPRGRGFKFFASVQTQFGPTSVSI